MTAARTTRSESGPLPEVAKPALPGKSVPFRLLLSAPAAEVEIDTGKTLSLPPDGPSLSGTLELDPRNPRVGLIVRWKTPASAGEHRFAKLTLEAPGKDSFTHVFDAGGDIDDLLELPLPATR